MANLYWMNPNTGETAFTLEFDESVVESEFSELVYGLIENANGDAHRQNETIASQRECIAHLRNEALTHQREMVELQIRFDDLKQYNNGELVPMDSDIEIGLRPEDLPMPKIVNTEYNDMGDKMYNSISTVI